MRRALVLLWLYVLLPTARAADLDALVEASRKAWDVPGCAVAVVHDDKILLLKGYGVREQGKPDKVTAETRFGIGSLTKAVTATALAKLVEERKLDWDDPVRKHVPFFRLKDELADRDATIRDLLCHRVGLARHDLLWSGAPWSLEESVRRMAHLDLDQPFRSGFLYNNLTYIALGFVVTSASGRPWHEYVEKQLFEPIGMTSVVWTRTALRDSKDRSRPHVRWDGKVEPIEWYDDDKQVRASGSVKTNAKDLVRWMRFHLGEGTLDGKEIVKRRVLEETYRPQVVTPVSGLLEREADTTQASYGLGWRVRDHRGVLVREHGGAVPGFRTHIALVPKTKTGVVVMSNLGDSEMPTALCYTLLDSVLGLSKKNWDGLMLAQAKRAAEAARKRAAEREATRKKDTATSRNADAYVGEYIHPAYGLVGIVRTDNGLSLKWSRYDVPLQHFHFDTFTIKDRDVLGGELVTFTLDADGDPTRLRFRGLDFARRKRTD